MIPATLARAVRGTRRALLRGPSSAARFASLFAATLALSMADARAQDKDMLDHRVTQRSLSETICRPGYADTVAPPFERLMAHKDRMLAARGIDAADGAALALDRHVPIVLGGAPDAAANFDLLPWGGPQGERRKARVAVMLKRCVCEGKLSLAQAQATIVGDWSKVYAGFGQTSCDIGRFDSAAGGAIGVIGADDGVDGAGDPTGEPFGTEARGAIGGSIDGVGAGVVDEGAVSGERGDTP